MFGEILNIPLTCPNAGNEINDSQPISNKISFDCIRNVIIF